jgi:hypothetical protein
MVRSPARAFDLPIYLSTFLSFLTLVFFLYLHLLLPFILEGLFT